MNFDTFYEVTSRLPDDTLIVLFSDERFRGMLVEFSKNMNWWFERVQYLLGRTITYRPADWRDVYVNLLIERTYFSHEHNYCNLTLIEILFEEIREDRDGIARHVAFLRSSTEVIQYAISQLGPTCYDLLTYEAIRTGNTTMTEILLSHPEVNPMTEEGIFTAARRDYLEVIQLLVADPRCSSLDLCSLLVAAIEQQATSVALWLLSLPQVDPSLYNNFAILTAVKNGDEEIVSALLEDARVDCSVVHSSSINCALSRGHIEVIQLLLSQPAFVMPDNIELPEDAINRNRIEIVRLVSEMGHDMKKVFSPDMVKDCSLPMLKLLMTCPNPIRPSVQDNRALKIARKFKRYDVVELLLQDKNVRLIDERAQYRRARRPS